MLGIVWSAAPAASTIMSAPQPPDTSRIASCASTARGSHTASAPICAATARRPALTSNAITVAAPAARASAIAPSPIGPQPNTATCALGLNPPADTNIPL